MSTFPRRASRVTMASKGVFDETAASDRRAGPAVGSVAAAGGRRSRRGWLGSRRTALRDGDRHGRSGHGRHWLRVAAVALAAAALLPAPPATALTCIDGTCSGGHFWHYSPDDGYDPGIIIVCNYGSGIRKTVMEGEWSNKYCGIDTDQIYIRDGEELWCKLRAGYQPWTLVFDASGYHKIHDLWGGDYVGCTLRVD